MAFRDNEGGGYSLHGWSGDMHHLMAFRGAITTDGATITAQDYFTFREYAGGGLNGSSPFLFYHGGSTQTLCATIGDYTYVRSRIGVGTQSPSYNLHVNGSFYASGSSREYKQNIAPYTPSIDLIDKLQPVTYTYKDKWKHLGRSTAAGDIQLGLIAEDVAEVCPELAITVQELDKTVVRNVDYEKLTIVLLAEVQALRKRVAELEKCDV